MPISSTVTDLSVALTAQLTGGSGSARTSFGEKSQAFAWAGDTMNAAIGAIDSAVALNRNFTAVRVANTTPVVPIVDGVQKPVTATLTPETVSLLTFPGVVELKTSDITDSANIGQAVSHALYAQALVALDKHLVTQLVADGTDLDHAVDMAGIALAQAQIMASGGFGDLLILSAADYATLVGTATGAIVGSNDPRVAQLQILGAQVVVSSSLATGTAICMDRSAALAVELDASPVALVDVHARLNSTDVVIECIGGAICTRPDGVVVIADVTP